MTRCHDIVNISDNAAIHVSDPFTNDQVQPLVPVSVVGAAGGSSLIWFHSACNRTVLARLGFSPPKDLRRHLAALESARAVAPPTNSVARVQRASPVRADRAFWFGLDRSGCSQIRFVMLSALTVAPAAIYR